MLNSMEPSYAQQHGAQSAAGIVGNYSVTQTGPDSRIWGNFAGQTVTEISTGMNFLDATTQQWSKSDASFVVAPDGSAFTAQRMQHKVTIDANLNAAEGGAVTAVTPDGITLNSTPVAIVLYDSASGKSVTVASLTNSVGVLLDPQHIIYKGALVGDLLQADVLYTLPDCGSFHQDVLISKFNGPLDPTIWGFSASATNTIQIKFLTEFYGDVPAPQRVMLPIYIEQDPAQRAVMASPDIIDYTIAFGDHYIFGPGRAYVAPANLQPQTGGGLPRNGVRVAKDFISTGQPARSFLVESVPYSWLQTGLQNLPPTQTSARGPLPGEQRTKVATVRRQRSSGALAVANSQPYDSVPRAGQGSHPASIATKATGAMLAELTKGNARVVMDYVITINSMNEPTTYTNGNTYFVDGPVYVNNATVQAGAVFKYPTPAVGTLDIGSTLTVTSGSGSYGYFTAGDDDSLGQTLNGIWSGYTGNTTGKYYGNPALQLEMWGSEALSSLSFYYAQVAVDLNIDGSPAIAQVSNSAFKNCVQGILITGSGGDSGIWVGVSNCQMQNVQFPINSGSETITGGVTNSAFTACTQVITNNQHASASSWSFVGCTYSNVVLLTSSNGPVAATSSGVHLFGITNGQVLTGVVSLPIMYGNTDPSANFTGLTLMDNNALAPETGAYFATSGGPGNYWYGAWDTTQLANGTYTVYATAAYDDGTVVNDNLIAVNVYNTLSFPNQWNFSGNYIYVGAQTPYTDGNGIWYLYLYGGLNGGPNTNYIGYIDGPISTNGYFAAQGEPFSLQGFNFTNQWNYSSYSLVYYTDSAHPIPQGYARTTLIEDPGWGPSRALQRRQEWRCSSRHKRVRCRKSWKCSNTSVEWFINFTRMI